LSVGDDSRESGSAGWGGGAARASPALAKIHSP